MTDNSGFTFQQLHRPSVVDRIIETMKQAVIRGDLKPGQRLPSEAELVQQLGVGRSAVREAMKVLEALGVVNIIQGNGTFIADKPSPNMLSPLVFAILLESNLSIELFELRFAIQLGYCSLAAQNATEDDWANIEAAAIALEEYARQEEIDTEVLTQYDLNFHYAILDATHNPLIIKIGRTVEELFFTSIHNTLVAYGQPDTAIESHRGIMRAMRGGNLNEIRAAIEISLVHWKEEIQDETGRITLKKEEPK